MTDPLSPDAFYASAREFALSTLEAHHVGNHRRVPLDAGTALEHLAKASLARRSPALLLTDLKNDSGIPSLMWLLRIDGAKRPAKVRTVGLSDALTRAELFVPSKSAKDDLRTIVELRNGTVHAAEDAGVEERILAAFAKYTDALLADLGRAREDFWGGQLSVVDALLKDASDKLAHKVEVRRAAAEAMLESLLATRGEAVVRALRTVSKSPRLTDSQRFHPCPVCDSHGIATGGHDVIDREVWFAAQKFHCQLCGLRLDSEAEIDELFDPVWEIEDADWRDYEPADDGDAAYERLREETRGI